MKKSVKTSKHHPPFTGKRKYHTSTPKHSKSSSNPLDTKEVLLNNSFTQIRRLENNLHNEELQRVIEKKLFD